MGVRSTILTTASEEAPRKRRIALAPAWAHQAADWLAPQPSNWRVVGIVLGSIMIIIGGALLFGGGYTSIQGVRIPVALLLAPWNIVVSTNGLPPLSWWIIPLVTNLIQIFARRIPGLRPLWWPSVIY